jgi:hypothetical protein
VVDPQFVAERQVEADVYSLAQQVPGQVLVAAHEHPGQAELPFLVVEVRVVKRRLAHEELRHVVQPQLVEMVGADHDQDVGAGAGEGFAERLDLGHPFIGERRPVGAGGRAGPVVERVMCRCDDRGDGGHGGSWDGGARGQAGSGGRFSALCSTVR